MTETWLTDHVYSNEILPPTYTVDRRDRDTRGGGVMIAVSDLILSKLIFSSDTIEMIAVELYLSPKVLICCLYIPPNCSPTYLENVLIALDSLSADYDVIITGDFNVPDINWCNLTASSQFSSSLCDVLFAKNFQQIIHEPTHIHGNVLDLVLTTNPERIHSLSITDVSSSSCKCDHYLVEFYVISKYCSRNDISSCSVFNYAAGDYDGMECYLLDKSFDFTCNNIEEVWLHLKFEIFSACNVFIPKTKCTTYKFPKWFTPEIKHAINRVRSLKRKIKKSSCATKLAKLTSLESELQALMSTAKENYGTKLLSSFSHNSKVLYRQLRYLSKFSAMPQCLVYNSLPILHPKDKVEAFNNFFNSTFTVSNFVLPPMNQMPTPTDQLSYISVDESDVFDALINLNPLKAQGCDNISPYVLKYCATSLVTSVTRLFTACLTQYCLPQEWKIHKIRPIPKKGDLSNVSNYRPISLLCCLSKVMEAIVYMKIIPFIYPKINKCQFGFLENRSCLSQLLCSFSHIYNAIESKKSCDVIYLDFRKAFDSVPHNELLFKLWRMGITGPLWLWFKAYLKGRSHFVSLDSVSSDMFPVMSGVPQGSVLGLLLFLIYINDLPQSLSLGSIPYLFADDSKLVRSIASFSDCSVLQEDIFSIMEWCRTWNLNLNKEKCAAIHFSLSSSLNPQSDYKIMDTSINFIESHRDLGIMVNNKLSWSKHYDYISLKAYRSLHLIYRTIPPSGPANL